MGLGVWSTGTARENGMLLFALISGFAFGIYDSLGLELVMDSLPDPRRAGHDLGIYALANSAGLALAAIIGALLVTPSSIASAITCSSRPPSSWCCWPESPPSPPNLPNNKPVRVHWSAVIQSSTRRGAKPWSACAT